MEFDFDQIDSIINARSLAIVGASNKPMKFGTLLTASQLGMGFDGPIYLVNPSEDEIMGRKSYPDLLSLPESPDLVCTTVPAPQTAAVLTDCARKGVRGVVIMAAGYGESGQVGVDLEMETVRIARDGGFRVIGPNCFGIYNPRNGLTMLPGYDFTREVGDIAFISQSGGFGVHVVRQSQSLGLRFSTAVSYGNAADIDEADLFTYLARDEQTAVAAAYLEGISDGDRFIQAVEELTTSKTLILWKVGKAEISKKAVASHTGSIAGSSDIWDAMTRQHGVIRASGVDEVVDILLALKYMGRKPGRRLLIAGGGGGLGTYAADLAEEEGLDLPPLEPETLASLEDVLGNAGAVAGNPLDIGAPLIPPREFEASMTQAARNPSTDVLILDLAINFVYMLAGDAGLELATDILIKAHRETGKPLVAVLYSRSFDREDMTFEEALRRFRWKLLENGIAVFPSMPRALRAISRIN